MDAMQTAGAETPVVSPVVIGGEKWGTAAEGQVRLFEWGAGMLCVLYVVIGVTGYLKNRRMSKQLEKVLVDICEPQFAQVGMTEGDKTLMADGISTYLFYATGRVNVKSLTAIIELRERQDMFAGVSEVVFGAAGDTMKVVLPLSGPAEQIILAIAKRENIKKIRQANNDLDTFTMSVPWPNGTSGVEPFEILAESADIVPLFFTTSVQKTMAASSQYLHSIHITDQGVALDQSRGEKNVLVMQMVLPTRTSDMHHVDNLVKLAIALSDRHATLNLAKNARESISSHRRLIDDILFKEKEKERQEEAQRKKLEKKQKEKEDMTGRSREAQRKFEEKEARREVKKKQRSMIKMAK
eukprot:Plantae.Rhodophyta-Purpureofilum_apyrenoidigerum.ctg3414.p1 GENE.Plantae.Rhodophyta-Purpureofilum_apyrenoidigerum.ctg3414~~Plantae.Rhodophyta-Purpureofilum_apyrenoidigerum.ctg3414.p1  ORF type:complete len:354 (+),score=86.32 Plantae.Rhodophyta-Purpureofilum_apyrenoidigerum.ctg3414:110-1171(+)